MNRDDRRYWRSIEKALIVSWILWVSHSIDRQGKDLAEMKVGCRCQLTATSSYPSLLAEVEPHPTALLASPISLPPLSKENRP